MFGIFKKKKSAPIWNNLTLDQARKQSKILVIDDKEFPYVEAFKDSGYNIRKDNDATHLNLKEILSGEFTIVLLDLQEVGRDFSTDQGLGVLKHIKTYRPHQVVVAFSEGEWRLKHQSFFDLADRKIDKSEDFLNFKKMVDDLLLYAYSPEHYKKAILSCSHMRFALEHNVLESLLRDMEQGVFPSQEQIAAQISIPDAVKTISSILSAAKTSYELWKTFN